MLGSCGTGLNINKSKLRYFDNSFCAAVDNRSFKVKGRRYGDLTLLDLFEIRDVNIDTVYISFSNKDELQFNWTEKGHEKHKTFNGHFLKKGYYEFYFRKQKKEIP